MSKGGTVVHARGEDTKAKSFSDAVSMIEQISAAEMEMDLPEGSYPTFSKLSFSAVAVRHAVSTTLLTFLMAPFSMLVIGKWLPAFGNMDPGLGDRIFALLLSAAPAVSFSFFFVYVMSGVYIRGKLTRILLSYYVNSYIIVKFIATFFLLLLVFVFHGSVMTPDRIDRFCSGLESVVGFVGYEEVVVSVEDFLTSFRHVLIKSALFATFVHVGCAVLIGVGYLRSYLISARIDTLRREWD